MNMMTKNKKSLTIFTPTYNRANFLPKLYQCLSDQTSKDFIWMVIDDGSTDETEPVVQKMIQDGKIAIDYVKKNNGGKYTAYNMAVKRCKTDLIFIAMDSDDLLKPYAVEKIIFDWKTVKNEDVVGMVYMCEDANGKLMLSEYDEEELKKCPSLQAATVNGWFSGEAEYIFKTKYLYNYLYPERKGETFFNELYSYIQMTGAMVWHKESIYVRAYQEGGITKNFLSTVIKSPLNYADYANTVSKFLPSFLKKAKYTFYYNTFSSYGGRHSYPSRSYNPIMSYLLLPFGFIASEFLKRKFSR